MFYQCISILIQGDKILEVSAFDGDYAHPRKIRYGLDPAGLPYSSFFEVNPDSGVITLRKSLTVSLKLSNYVITVKPV